jgi:hypothetical protein
MIYRIVTYDRRSERMRGNLRIPPHAVDQIKKIAGFQPNDDGQGEYLLDEEQLRRIAQQLEFRPEPEKFYYYVEPYQPPEDDGLQQTVGEAE